VGCSRGSGSGSGDQNSTILQELKIGSSANAHREQVLDVLRLLP